MKVTRIIFVLLLCSTVQVNAASVQDDYTKTASPISFNMPLYFINDSNEHVHIGTGMSSSFRVSKSFFLGFCFRLWGTEPIYLYPIVYPYGNYSDEEIIRSKSYSYSTLVNLEYYPISNNSIFIRFGSGLSVIPKEENLYAEDVSLSSKLFTILTGIGIDVPIADHLYITPQYEITKFFNGETPHDRQSSWLFNMGLSLTMR